MIDVTTGEKKESTPVEASFTYSQVFYIGIWERFLKKEIMSKKPLTCVANFIKASQKWLKKKDIECILQELLMVQLIECRTPIIISLDRAKEIVINEIFGVLNKWIWQLMRVSLYQQALLRGPVIQFKRENNEVRSKKKCINFGDSF